MKNSEFKEITRVLSFIENDLKVNLQLTLLNQPKKKNPEKQILDPFRICFSKEHNTNALICKDFYKQTF